MLNVWEIKEWETTEPIALEGIGLDGVQTLQVTSQKTRWFDVLFQGDSIQLKACGYVGQCLIPLPNNTLIKLIIRPKIPLNALMEWWCWSNQLFEMDAPTIPLDKSYDILEQLMLWLCQRISQQIKQGLHSSYLRTEQPIHTVRGKLKPLQTALSLSQGNVAIHCRFDERTQDTVDNQILLWTLHQCRRWGGLSSRARLSVAQQYRALQHSISLKPFTPQECWSLSYNRQNQSYQPLHQLCGMILSQLSINETLGDTDFPTFMLPMHQIFEDAVANGLKRLLPTDYRLKFQDPITISNNPYCVFKPDLVLFHLDDNSPVMVLDTKYKRANTIDSGNLQQVVAYALALGIEQAQLIYPEASATRLDTTIGNIHCQTSSVIMASPPHQAISDWLHRHITYARTHCA